MAKQNGVIIYPTLANFKADTIITQQKGDVVNITGVLTAGTTHIARTASTETPDDVFTIRKTNDATLTFWASAVNDLLGSALSVAFVALPDNTEDVVTIALTGVVVGKSYDFGVISGLPAGVEISLQPVTTADSLSFLIKNNTGTTLTAGTISVNVYN